jgi:hypothetical protein
MSKRIGNTSAAQILAPPRGATIEGLDMQADPAYCLP